MNNLCILDCPSCGASAKIRVKNRTIINGETTRNCYVYCPECDFRGPRVLYSDFELPQEAHIEAINRWNRRV